MVAAAAAATGSSAVQSIVGCRRGCQRVPGAWRPPPPGPCPPHPLPQLNTDHTTQLYLFLTTIKRTFLSMFNRWSPDRLAAWSKEPAGQQRSAAAASACQQQWPPTSTTALQTQVPRTLAPCVPLPPAVTAAHRWFRSNGTQVWWLKGGEDKSK